MPAIYDVLEGVNREELIQKMVSVEFTRFFNYYNRAKDLNTSEISDGKGNLGTSSGSSVRYFINVGEKDNFDWMSLKDFLKETLAVGKEDIYKVDVKDSFSFFNSDAELTERILATFSDFKVDGRFINVEISKKPEGGGGRRSRDRNRKKNGGRSKGKRRESNSFKSGGRRSGKRRGKRRDGLLLVNSVLNIYFRAYFFVLLVPLFLIEVNEKLLRPTYFAIWSQWVLPGN